MIKESIVKKIKNFAVRYPFLFVIFLILSSLIVEVVAGILVALLLHVKQADPIFAPVVLLITTLYLVFILWSFAWLKSHRSCVFRKLERVGGGSRAANLLPS